MRAVRLCFFQMLTSVRQDMMLFAACLAPVLAGFFFRYAIPFAEAALAEQFQTAAVIAPYYALIDILLAMLTPAMFSFVPAMVSLEEADEGMAAYLFVTPLGRNGYLLARFLLPSAAALTGTIVLLALFRLTALSAADMVLLAAAGTLQGMILSMLIVTLSSNKLEGMAVAKLSSLMMLPAAVPFFVGGNVQYVMALFPSFWAGKAAAGQAPFYMLPAFALSAGWLLLLLRRYLRKM